MTNCKAIRILVGVCGTATAAATRLESKTRSSRIANNAIPDSIIMNTTCRNLVPPVEPNLEVVAFTSKNTLRILNTNYTIKPVTRTFTAMDAAKLVRPNVFPQVLIWLCTTVIDPSATSQLARGDKLKSAYQINEDRLTDLVRMRLLRMKERSQRGYFYPTRSSNGRSLKICVNKTDDRHNNGLVCIL